MGSVMPLMVQQEEITVDSGDKIKEIPSESGLEETLQQTLKYPVMSSADGENTHTENTELPPVSAAKQENNCVPKRKKQWIKKN